MYEEELTATVLAGIKGVAIEWTIGNTQQYQFRNNGRTFLIVEVAHSSLAHDRRKAATYARAGVSEYWIVDLAHQTVEVYRRPVAGRYEHTTTHRRPDVLRAEAFADIEIPLDRVLRG